MSHTSASACAGASMVGVSPFACLEKAFRRLCTGPHSLALDGSLIEAGLPNRAIAFDELRARLLHPSCSYAVRDAALNVVLDRARAEGGAWLVGLAGLLLPGLRRAAKPLTRACPGAAADVEAEILTGLLAAIQAAAPGRPRPAARLVWAARRAGERLLRAERAEQAQPTGSLSSTAPSPPCGHPDLVLARAVAVGVLCADDAELIGATRLGEASLADAAATRGIGYKAAAARRVRAERALVAWLHIEMQDIEMQGEPGDAGEQVIDATRRRGFVADGGANRGSKGGGRPRGGHGADRRPEVRHHPDPTAPARR